MVRQNGEFITNNQLIITMRLFSMCFFLLVACGMTAQDLKLNDLEYFERQGVNVLVFNNSFNGGFNDEKNSGIEIIHHGVRTVQGGAIRLNNTPEQWDLVPEMTSRKVNKENGSIEVALRYEDYDFDSRVIVTAKGKAVEIAVYLDKPVPAVIIAIFWYRLPTKTLHQHPSCRSHKKRYTAHRVICRVMFRERLLPLFPFLNRRLHGGFFPFRENLVRLF